MFVELSPQHVQQFAGIASESGKTTRDVVFEVRDHYLRERAELLADLDQARADVAARRILTSEQVWERLEKHLIT